MKRTNKKRGKGEMMEEIREDIREGNVEKNNDVILSTEDDMIANAMLETKGNLSLVSRMPNIYMNAMALRNHVANNPHIRMKYHELLSLELQENGLHIAERILEMSKLQQEAYGDMENSIPPDPKMAIELSKEISRLIKESKETNVSSSSAVLITSKESAAELLKHFLDS